MIGRLQAKILTAYERHLTAQLETTPDHVAVIQDGNRRYARKQGKKATAGHRAGAETTEQVLRWCQEFDIKELTLYAFSTENFRRPSEEQEAIFELIERKLREFAEADDVHRNGVNISIIGQREQLPDSVRAAASYAESKTAGYDQFALNVALAYGGRASLLSGARSIAQAAAARELDPEEIDVQTVEKHLYDQSVSDVDLIIRTGGNQRTSNFLPWHANGNEAAVYFCAPYWPSFSRVDFLRGMRTYQARKDSWEQHRTRRSLALLRHLGQAELEELDGNERDELRSKTESQSPAKQLLSSWRSR